MQTKEKEVTNGGTTEKIEHVEQQKEALNTQPLIKEPIFLGEVPDPVILQRIEEMIDQERFEIAILSPNLQQSCRETYFFNKLGEAERENMLKASKDKEKREKALQVISLIDEMFKLDLSNREVDLKKDSIITFKSYELKILYQKYRRTELSNKQIQELIEFLQIQGFLTPSLLNVPYIKQEFAITIDDTSRLQILNLLVSELDNQILDLTARRNGLEQKALEMSSKISETEQVDLVPLDELLKGLTPKQSSLLEILKAEPERFFKASELSSVLGKKANDTIQKLVNIGLAIVRLDEKDNNIYALNKDKFDRAARAVEGNPEQDVVADSLQEEEHVQKFDKTSHDNNSIVM